MKRHLSIFYVFVVALLIAGHMAWHNCMWEIMSSVSSAAIIFSILVSGWRVIRLRPESGDEIVLKGELLATTRVAIVVICVGALIAGFGDVFGRHMFGCR